MRRLQLTLHSWPMEEGPSQQDLDSLEELAGRIELMLEVWVWHTSCVQLLLEQVSPPSQGIYRKPCAPLIKGCPSSACAWCRALWLSGSSVAMCPAAWLFQGTMRHQVEL